MSDCKHFIANTTGEPSIGSGGERLGGAVGLPRRDTAEYC